MRRDEKRRGPLEFDEGMHAALALHLHLHLLCLARPR
jgi:hypothetical protein